jgi:hypothetical protein
MEVLHDPRGRCLERWRDCRQKIGCPPGIRTPIGCSRGSCPTIERGGNSTKRERLRSEPSEHAIRIRCNSFIISGRLCAGQTQRSPVAGAMLSPNSVKGVPTLNTSGLIGIALRRSGLSCASSSQVPALQIQGAGVTFSPSIVCPCRNLPIVSFKNFSSAGLLAAPAVCPQSEGIGSRMTPGMNGAS